jgi:glucan phosphoethanolaminetransferase (alkaline phosphatase superfamily)
MQSIPLKTLMDVFQGCYRHSKRDCRYFAAFYLLIRIAFPLAILLLNCDLFYKLGVYGLLFILMAVVLLFAKPYIKEADNTIDIFFFMLFAMGFFMIFLASIMHKISHTMLSLCGATVLSISLLYGVMIGKEVLPEKLLTLIRMCCQLLISRFRPTEELNEVFRYRYEEEHVPLIRSQ